MGAGGYRNWGEEEELRASFQVMSKALRNNWRNHVTVEKQAWGKGEKARVPEPCSWISALPFIASWEQMPYLIALQVSALSKAKSAPIIFPTSFISYSTFPWFVIVTRLQLYHTWVDQSELAFWFSFPIGLWPWGIHWSFWVSVSLSIKMHTTSFTVCCNVISNVHEAPDMQHIYSVIRVIKKTICLSQILPLIVRHTIQHFLIRA